MMMALLAACGGAGGAPEPDAGVATAVVATEAVATVVEATEVVAQMCIRDRVGCGPAPPGQRRRPGAHVPRPAPGGSAPAPPV